MRSADKLPSVNRLRECFAYDSETGLIHWLRRVSNSCKADRPVGYVGRDGYLISSLDGFRMAAHRMAWAIAKGAWPTGEIDHINGIRSDNRLANLRDVSHAENMQNMLFAKSTNKTTGLVGAHYHRITGKYRSQLKVNGRRIELGLFHTPQEAHEAYVRAKLAALSLPIGNSIKRY